MMIIFTHKIAQKVVTQFCKCFEQLLLADQWHVSQVITGDKEQGGKVAESALSGEITTSSNLSCDISSDLTAERRRELWRRAHDRPESREV